MHGRRRGSWWKTCSVGWLPEAVLDKTRHWLASHPQVRVAGLTVYYLAIIIALILLYGRGDLATPPFVYQDF